MQNVPDTGVFTARNKSIINANFGELQPALVTLFVDLNVAGNVTHNGETWGTAFGSVTEALNAVVSGTPTTIKIAPGFYDEAITITKPNVTLIGVGGRGSVGLEPSASNATGITISGAEDVTLVNVGGAGDGTGGGLLLTGDCSRFRATGCKFEGGAFATKVSNTATASSSDLRFVDNEFAWTTTAFHITGDALGDPTTQVLIANNLFHNYTTDGVLNDTLHTVDLWIVGNVFANQEDATEPTQYLDIDQASTTGLVAWNVFATTVLAAAKLAIAAGVIWCGNQVQAEGAATGGGTSGRPD